MLRTTQAWTMLSNKNMTLLSRGRNSSQILVLETLWEPRFTRCQKNISQIPIKVTKHTIIDEVRRGLCIRKWCLKCIFDQKLYCNLIFCNLWGNNLHLEDVPLQTKGFSSLNVGLHLLLVLCVFSSIIVRLFILWERKQCAITCCHIDSFDSFLKENIFAQKLLRCCVCVCVNCVLIDS